MRGCLSGRDSIPNAYLCRVSELPDSFHTIAAAAEAEFKDRGSRFLGYAYPVRHEEEAMVFVEALRKEHFKARHHCYAWRLGTGGDRFRANDDGEPSGTAGRPILGRIDAVGLTDVAVIVVRYFGGTLLGTSGLIHAYREAAAAALQAASVIEKVIEDTFWLDFDYALMPDLMQALKKGDVHILDQDFTDRGRMHIGLRRGQAPVQLLHLRAALLKVSNDEATGLEWPAGMTVSAGDVVFV